MWRALDAGTRLPGTPGAGAAWASRLLARHERPAFLELHDLCRREVLRTAGPDPAYLEGCRLLFDVAVRRALTDPDDPDGHTPDIAAVAREWLRQHLDSREPIARLWRIGLPVGGQWVIEMLAYSLFTTLIARMGDAAMAASHAFGQLASLSFMQAAGISSATATLVGRYIGAGDPDRAAQRFRSSLLLGGSAGAAIALAFLLAPSMLVEIFSNDPDVIALGVMALAWAPTDRLCPVPMMPV